MPLTVAAIAAAAAMAARRQMQMVGWMCLMAPCSLSTGVSQIEAADYALPSAHIGKHIMQDVLAYWRHSSACMLV